MFSITTCGCSAIAFAQLVAIMKFGMLLALPILLAVTLVLFPNQWVGFLMLVDFYTPYKLFHSPMFEAYHSFLVSRLTEQPEIPLPEIDVSQATYENVWKASKGFTFPVVIRGLIKDTYGVKNWGNADWWLERYADEELMCGTFAQINGVACTVKGFLDAFKAGNPFYVSGASQIFERHPELHEMIDNAAVRAIEPGNRTATQLFWGLPGMGSDIHTAIGINIFRQVTGQKKWWFIMPSETAYLWPAINVNGFSAHTMTKIGKDGPPSPWFTKLPRYTTVLKAGDGLINPPWIWHGILNMDNNGRTNSTSFVIGSPTRYGMAGGITKSRGWHTAPLLTANAYYAFYRKYGKDVFTPGFKPNLQKDIANNRHARVAEFEEEGVKVKEHVLHPFDEAD